MALPANITTKTVTGKFYDMSTELPASGSITFTPSFSSSVWALDPAASTVLVPAPKTIQLDAAGFFTTTLACTNDTDLAPLNFTWHVKLVASGLVTEFDFALPTSATSPVDLSQVATVPTLPAPLTNFAKSVNGVFPDVNGNITVFTIAPTILDNMSDVNATTPTDKDILSFNLAAGEWQKSGRLTTAEGTIVTHTSQIANLQSPGLYVGGECTSSSAQSLGASSATKLQFPTVTRTFNGVTFDGVSTFTIPSDGPYHFDAQLRTATAVSGAVAISGTSYSDATLILPPLQTATGAWGDVGRAGTAYLTAGQQVCAYFFNNTASATTVAHATRPAKFRIWKAGMSV